MKRSLVLSLLAAMALTGCTTFDTSSEPSTSLTLRCYIDGVDQLKIRHNEVWYVHTRAPFVEHCLPGQWSGRNEPTYVNDDPWYPQWARLTSDRYTIADSNFALPANVAFTEETMTVTMDGLHNKVEEYPNAENGYTLVIRLDDLDHIGATWFTVDIQWDR